MRRGNTPPHTRYTEKSARARAVGARRSLRRISGDDQTGAALLDVQEARELVATGFEVLEVDLPVVVGRVQVGELRQHRGLVDLRCLGLVGRIAALLGTLCPPLLLGPLAGLLVAV